MALAQYLGPAGLAVVTTPGVIQADDDTQLEPDLLVVPVQYADSESWRRMTGWWLAVEVSGLASRVYDRDFKTDAYLRLGVREVWRLDLRDRTLFVSRQGGPANISHTGSLTWHPVEMPEPFQLDLGTVLPPRPLSQ
jgi:hypothetical protein